jgi:hypothetical protein
MPLNSTRESLTMADNDAIPAKSKLVDDSDMDEEPAPKRAKTVEEPRDAAERPAAKPKSAAKNDDMSWICGECKEADCMMQPSCSEFIICDGRCERIFHYPCAGLSELPHSDEDWICKDCTSLQHQCAICHDYGKDNEEVFRCKKDKCGLFFHESCLELQDVEVTMVSATKTTSDTENGTNPEAVTVPVFTCPAHNCWTCIQHDMLKNEQEKQKAEKQASATNGQKKTKKKRKKKQPTIFQKKTETRLYVSQGMQCR